MGYSIVHHGTALYDYVISCHTKYNSRRNQCDIRAAHDGKDECDTLAWLVVDHRSRVFAYDRLAAFCVVTTSTIKKEQAV